MVEFTQITQHAFSLRGWILISGILFYIGVSNGGTQLQSKSCTGQQASANRNSFKFRKIGNVSNLEDCVDFCCKDDTCELAIFSRGFHCFGVSCYEPKLCHKILDRLLMDDERELQRNARNTGTKDFIRHTSQIANPTCPQRFVPSFQVLLLGAKTQRAFQKLHGQSTDVGQCNAQCCKSSDCLLSFIEDDECYGVTGHQAGHDRTKRAQAPRIGLQVAIIDRNREVSRSLDDEDEDPDELGSDDFERESSAARQEAAILKLHSNPRKPVQENKPSAKTGQVKLHSFHRSKVFSSAKSPSRSYNDKNFSKNKHTSRSSKDTIITASSHTHFNVVHPVVKANVVHSKISSQKSITSHDKTILQPSKGNYSHISHLITKNTALNAKVTVKGASQRPNRVGPSKAKNKTTVKLTEEDRTTAGPRQQTQRTQTAWTSKTNPDVKHHDQAYTISESKGSKFGKIHQRNGVKMFTTFSTKKWFAPRVSTSGMKEGRSKEDESSMSGDNEEFSGDSDLSGEGDLSGDGRPSGAGDFRTTDKSLSGDDEDVTSGTEDVSGQGENWSGADENLSNGGNELSGHDESFSGTDEHFNGGSSNTDKIRNVAMHSEKSRTRDKTDNKARKTADVDVLGSGDKGKKKFKVTQNKEGSKGIDRKRKKIDLVKDLDDLQSDEDGSKVASKKVVTLPQKSSISKTTKHNDEAKENDLVEDLDDLGSDEGDSKETLRNSVKKASVSKKTLKHGTKTDNKHLNSKEDNAKKIDLVEDLDELGSDEDDSKVTSKIVLMSKKPSISKVVKNSRNTNSEHLNFKNESKLKKTDVVEDLDDLGSDNDDTVESKLGQRSENTSRKDASLPKKTNRVLSAGSKTIPNVKNTGNEHRNFKQEGKEERKTGKRIDLFEDPDALGADDDDILNSNEERRKTTSNSVESLPQRTNSNSENLHSKTRDTKSKKTSKMSGKEVRQPKDREKKVANTSTFQSRPSQKADAVGTHVKDNANTDNGSFGDKEHVIKATDESFSLNDSTKKKAKSKEQITRSMEREKKHQDGHRQLTVKPLTVANEKRIKQSGGKTSIGQIIKTRINGTDLVDKSTEVQSITNHSANNVRHTVAKITQENRHITAAKSVNPTKASLARKKLKVVFKPNTSNGELKDKATQTGSKKALIRKASEKKDKNDMKNRSTSTTKVKSKSKVVVEKSVLQGDSTKSTSAKSVKSGKVQKSYRLRSKATPKQRKTSSLSSNHKLKHDRTFQKKGKVKSVHSSSKLQDVDDLMKYAHRIGSAKSQPAVTLHVGGFLPTAKQATFGKTATPQQQHKSMTNRNKTVQGHRPISVYLHATLQKGHSLHQQRPLVQKAQSASIKKKSKFAAKSLQTTPNAVLPTTRAQVSSKVNRSLAFHPTFSPNLHVKSQDRNLPVGNHSTSNNAFLSIKQRSNDRSSLDVKEEFLSHFHKGGNSSDGIEFSVKSGGRHRKGKHSKHVDSIDVEDLGDADFDIMMSNDITHRDLPKKKKSKKKGHKEKHAGNNTEKLSEMKGDDSGKEIKKKKGDEKKEQEDDSEESEKKSATRHTSHKSKKRKNRLHQHHEKSEQVANSDDESHSTRHKDDRKKSERKQLHHHSKHDESDSTEQKDDGSRDHHTKHRHRKKKTEDDENKDDDNDVKGDDEVKTIHKHKKKENDDEKKDEDEITQRPHHHRHKTHVKKYNSNKWVGKVIPGKVKVTYKGNSGKSRHRKHKVEDEEEETHHKRKHGFEEHENHKDSSEETERKNSHSHSHHTHHVESDDHKRKEKSERFHKNREEDKEQERAKGEDNEEKEEHAEKRTDVNYEAIKSSRHRFNHYEEEKHHYEEEKHYYTKDDNYHREEEVKHHENEQKHEHDDSNDDDNDLSKRKNVNKDDDGDDTQKNDHSGEEDGGDADDDDEKEEHPSEQSNENRVVVGEDSENEDDGDERHSEQGDRRRHRHRHKNEYNGGEREVVNYHKSHGRHEHGRQWESKPKHRESHFESKEDNDGNDDADEGRRNFRKSFIYHKKKDKERHHNSERNREEHEGDDKEVNSEYFHENHDGEVHDDRRYRQRSYHHRHHHRYKPHVENERQDESDLDRYESNDVNYHQTRHHDGKEHVQRHHEVNEERQNEETHNDEPETFRRHHQLDEHIPPEQSEHSYRDYEREKELHHNDYISHKDEPDRWTFKEKHHHQDAPDQRDRQDSFDSRFMGEDRPPDKYPNYRHKVKPKRRKKGHWKNRYYYHDKEEHGYEDSGGSFDASSWIPNENYEDDSFYGGEGNYDRKKYRKKHRKHKHRKDRQSYEYWGYGDQNPYYYDYNYQKFRSRYENYPPQTRPSFDWHIRYRGYDGWKPKPRKWYPSTQHWDKEGSWRLHSKWRELQENRPTGYQRNQYYNDGNDDRVANQPKPTPYPRNPSSFLPPTIPRWQHLEATERGFRGNKWSPGQNQGPGDHYQDWSENRPSGTLHNDERTYGPQQHPSYGIQPQLKPEAFKPNWQMQPTGAQSKYVPPAPQQSSSGVVSQTRIRPTVRRQYPATPPSQVSSPTNISQIMNIMDKLNSTSTGGQHPNNVPSAQNKVNTSTKISFPKINLTSNDQAQDREHLNGFFNEQNGGKKSEILRPTNSSKGQPSRNTSANTSQQTHQNPPKTTLQPKTTQVANKTTVSNTIPLQKTNNQTANPSKAAQKMSTTAVPTHKSSTGRTPTAPDFGDVSQPDDSPESGTKHRKHRAPVCIAGKTTDDLTLLRGRRAGNFTNIGDVGDFSMCIKRCCQHQKCDLAFKSAENCFLVSCFTQESCQTSPSLDDIFSPRMSFVKRHLPDSDQEISGQDDDDEWNDKVSPSGIHEVCEAEKALGILWKKTVAGHYSTHPCPREAKGFVKRRCEADSRWLPPSFSDCVSSDYQNLYDKSRNLASGADPSPLIRELSQLTTQNIDNSLIFGGDLDRATDIMAAIVQHNGQTDLGYMTREDVENFVRASSNLLDMTNQQEWFQIQKVFVQIVASYLVVEKTVKNPSLIVDKKNKPGTAEVLRSMEMFALQAARRLPREDMAEPSVTNNIIIKFDRKSAGDGGLTFPDFSDPKVNRWDARHDIIALPSSVFDRAEDVNTASITFKSLPYLLPDSNVSTGVGPNSKVISTVMYPEPQGKITPPVTVVLSHIKRRRGNPKCVFWDYTLNPHRGGAWSTRGCWLAFNNQSHSICQCSHLSHLSNFAVLMDLSSDQSLQKEQKRERTMALMWIGIPVLVVGVIGGLYMSFSWNRKSGMASTATRPSTSLNEKTGLLGQRVVTSQVREEFPPSPTRDLYRALSPGYSPTGDLEWQDEFDFDVESGDQGFKQMLLPKLQLLQNQLINEFYDADKIETKKKLLLEGKLQTKARITGDTQVQCETVPLADRQSIQTKPQSTAVTPVHCEANHSVKREATQTKSQTTKSTQVQCKTKQSVDKDMIQAKTHIKIDNPSNYGAIKSSQHFKTSSSKKLRVRFADESLPGRNRTDEDKERFRRLQRMERRVFAQHLSRWTANSHLNLSD